MCWSAKFMRRFDSFSIISCIISPWPPQVCNPTMAATMATAERLGWNAMLVSSQTDRMAAETAEVSKICWYAPRSEQSVKMEPDSDPFQRDVPLAGGVEDTTKSGPCNRHNTSAKRFQRVPRLKTHPASSSIFAMRSCTFVFLILRL